MHMKKSGGELTTRTDELQRVNDDLLKIQLSLLPKFGPNWPRHSLVGMKNDALARVLYYAELYKQILQVPGVICEFGVQWGATLAELINLRSIFEPFNHGRTIVGFDTFSGFVSIDEKDGSQSSPGDYSSAENYEQTLEAILRLHEKAAPYSHLTKFELIKGDASVTIDRWLEENPHAIVAMAIFDMDLYKPTADVLRKTLPRLTKGSLLVFDELNCKQFPGETVAVREVIGTHNLKLRRMPSQPFCSWAVWGE